MDELVPEIKQFLEERGWTKLRPGDLSKSISIESAELLELFQWQNPSLEELKADEPRLEKFKKELADIFIYGLQACALLGLSPNEIIHAKLARVREKYPVDLVKTWKQNNDGHSNDYEQHKREHRATNTE